MLLLLGLLSSVICSDASSERWTPSPGGRAKPLPPCVLKPHVLTVHGVATCGPVPWADLLTKPVQVPAKGREAERNASTPLPSTQSNCSKRLLSYFLQVLIWTVWFSCFYYYFFFYFKKVTSKKNTDQDRLFYFTFSYFFFPFPIEPKGNSIPNHLPPPTHSFSFYAKLKMAIPYYSHNGRDSVCVWLCVICLLFFFKLWIFVKSEVTC